MTQREQAERALASIKLPSEQEVDDLENVRDTAQNRPPLGEADGSIDAPSWYALRDIVDALRTLRTATEIWHGRHQLEARKKR